MKSKPFSRPSLNPSDAFYGSSGSSATQWLQHYDIKLSGHAYTPKQYLAWLQVLLAGDAGAWAKTCPDIAHLLAESIPTQQTVASFTSLFCTRFQSLEEQPVVPEKPVIPEQPMPVIPQSAPSVPEQPTPQLPEPASQLPEQSPLQLPEQPVISQSAPLVPEQPTPQVPEQPVLPEQPTLQLPEQPVISQSAPSVLQQPITSVLSEQPTIYLPQQLPQPDFTFTLTHLTQQSVTTPHYWFWPIMGVG